MPNKIPYFNVSKIRTSPVKRYVKFLSVCKEPQSFKSVIKNSPDSVIKGI